MPELSQRILQRSQEEVGHSALDRLKGRLKALSAPSEPDAFDKSHVLSPDYVNQQNAMARHIGREEPYKRDKKKPVSSNGNYDFIPASKETQELFTLLPTDRPQSVRSAEKNNADKREETKDSPEPITESQAVKDQQAHIQMLKDEALLRNKKRTQIRDMKPTVSQAVTEHQDALNRVVNNLKKPVPAAEESKASEPPKTEPDVLVPQSEPVITPALLTEDEVIALRKKHDRELKSEGASFVQPRDEKGHFQEQKLANLTDEQMERFVKENEEFDKQQADETVDGEDNADQGGVQPDKTDDKAKSSDTATTESAPDPESDSIRKAIKGQGLSGMESQVKMVKEILDKAKTTGRTISVDDAVREMKSEPTPDPSRAKEIGYQQNAHEGAAARADYRVGTEKARSPGEVVTLDDLKVVDRAEGTYKVKDQQDPDERKGTEDEPDVQAQKRDKARGKWKSVSQGARNFLRKVTSSARQSEVNQEPEQDEQDEADTQADLSKQTIQEESPTEPETLTSTDTHQQIFEELKKHDMFGSNAQITYIKELIDKEHISVVDAVLRLKEEQKQSTQDRLPPVERPEPKASEEVIPAEEPATDDKSVQEAGEEHPVLEDPEEHPVPVPKDEQRTPNKRENPLSGIWKRISRGANQAINEEEGDVHENADSTIEENKQAEKSQEELEAQRIEEQTEGVQAENPRLLVENYISNNNIHLDSVAKEKFIVFIQTHKLTNPDEAYAKWQEDETKRTEVKTSESGSSDIKSENGNVAEALMGIPKAVELATGGIEKAESVHQPVMTQAEAEELIKSGEQTRAEPWYQKFVQDTKEIEKMKKKGFFGAVRQSDLSHFNAIMAETLGHLSDVKDNSYQSDPTELEKQAGTNVALARAICSPKGAARTMLAEEIKDLIQDDIYAMNTYHRYKHIGHDNIKYLFDIGKRTTSFYKGLVAATFDNSSLHPTELANILGIPEVRDIIAQAVNQDRKG